MFGFSQFPECSPGNLSIQIILKVVKNRIIRHGTFHNIISVCFSISAVADKIQPFICHFSEIQIIQTVIRSIIISIYISLTPITCRPSPCLFIIWSTIKSKIKIHTESAFSDYRIFYDSFTSMVQDHTLHPFSISWRIHSIRTSTIYSCSCPDSSLPRGILCHFSRQPRQQVAVACWAIKTGCPFMGVCLPS